ncbi:translocation/assembly module TamB domain-containing protein [Mucilaginibacter ximonensis]|uniref:Translocation/assembly module TamB domain-containing protein n=1 Tax=Mucilaginibacter ximonensis TaxID=538021 RepID=A0ABW5YDI3_9SPHI
MNSELDNKVIKKVLKIALSIVLFLLLTASVLVLLFQYKPVQTWAAKKAAHYLAKKLGTEVNVKSLYIKPFSSIVLEDFYVLDKSRDTLVRTPKLTVKLNGFSIFSSIQQRKLDFKLIQLDNGSVYLKNQLNGETNLQFVIDSLKSKDTVKTAPGKPWKLVFEKSIVNNFHFRYKDLRKHNVVNGINFEDLDVYNLSVTVNGMDLKNHLFSADVQHLTLKEKGGFYLKNYSAITTVDSNRILARHLFIQTPHSLIRNYLNMRFKSFKDFNDFTSKIDMDGHFNQSHISSTDIAYFTQDLQKINFELGVNGRIQGIVNNLKATDLTVTAGQATYVKGNFSLKGLPDWDHTYLDLKFDQIATNKKDLDYLYKHFTGNEKATTPDIVGRFGNVNFTGTFKGLQSDFTTAGTFKTQLGRFDPNIKFKTNKAGVPSYGGTLDAYNFNLAGLLNDNTFGRTTFKANVNGSGDELKNLNANISANIDYFDLKGYGYKNIAVNGNYTGKKINAKLSVNDKNVKFDGNGHVDFNPALPVYSVQANLHDANLNKLKLMGDTIIISAQLNTTFSGNSLKNFEGRVRLSPIRIIDPRNNYLLDSVYFAATGRGDSRLIVLRSDALDGTLKGSYDLATLPSYFKTIAKKYIPSLQTDITPPKPQNFELNVTIKNLDPLTAIFLPDLKIPEQGTFIGKFNSAEKTATINGYVKTINYKKILFHDFILDESTSDNNLTVGISLRQIDLSKDLFIKNIDITNFINNDSLKFNVKLADKDATNQLDLYGLVEFGRDTTAKLKLLPSDVIIEHQKWRLQEQVRIRLLDGKTQISGFELSNGEQVARINGFISDNAADKLKVDFIKFRMATLDELTKAADIKLHGIMNGDVTLSSILKSPGVDAQLAIDSFKMNNTTVGNIKLVSNLDAERSRANVKVNILNKGLETLNIGGSYFLGKGTDDKLDFDVKMTQTEAIIFEPFVKDLVSDLKGTVSTDLKLTGSLAKPQLNGSITLDNTGVMVNYLKAPFLVSDKLEVQNSVVKINKMILKDNHGGTGTANGTVDLNDLANPNIDVQLHANNLMALNTQFKDNHLYFGTAYATGDFSFAGPIDNMNININASTQAGTVFNIPLNTSTTASDYDFINFVSHKDTAVATVDKAKRFNGVTLNLNLNVDEKAVVKITTDYGVLQGSGQSKNLSLRINSLGDFDMFGEFTITSGKFDFTAKNFISKNFTVNQGGTIRWTGNPSNAQINLRAIYEVRAEVKPLYDAAGYPSPKGANPELVQAELLITNSLIQPDINFDFNFPTDPSIKDELATYLADNNNRNRQALSVIVTRSFASGAGTNNLTNQVVGTAYNAATEFAFNKINNIIAQSNAIKNLDLNIRSFNDVSATYKFAHERVILDGSLFNTTGSSSLVSLNNTLLNSNFSALTKDFQASYLIRKDGSLSGRYSYRALNNLLSTIDQNSVQYVNGIGLVYQHDFDTFGEFFRYIFNRRHAITNKDVAPMASPSTTPLSSPASNTPPPTTVQPTQPAKKDEED